MASDCLSVLVHTNRTTPKNSSISVVHLNSFLQQLNESASTMKTSHSSEFEMKLKYNGSEINSNVASMKNAEASVTKSSNSIPREKDSNDSMQGVRSKRSIHNDISNIIQEYVNYLLNYSGSHMHPFSKASSIRKL
jgi:hypothetical protein